MLLRSVLERAVLEVGAAAESARQRDLEVALAGVGRCGRVRVRVVLYQVVSHHIEDGKGGDTYQTAGDGGRSTVDDGLPDVEENAGSAVLVKGPSVAMLGAGIHIVRVKQHEAHVLTKGVEYVSSEVRTR